jgi:hypothetical protein
MKTKSAAVNANEVEVLVEELMKAKPCEKTVQSLMKKNGIPYSQDPIQQLNSVLMFINQPQTLEELRQKDAPL